MNKYKAIMAGAALLAIPALCSAALVTSFESGTLDGWWTTPMNGSDATANTDRASDGVYSAGVSFTVNDPGFAGWTVHEMVAVDARSILTAGSTQLSLDAYSDWANPNGWGVYGNNMVLVLNYEGGWTTVEPTSGTLVNGSFQTLTYDLTPWAATLANPALGYSNLGIGWYLGTWAGGGDGLDNGTQTLAVDNISVIPEPATIGLVACAGAGVLFVRRRLMM